MQYFTSQSWCVSLSLCRRACTHHLQINSNRSTYLNLRSVKVEGATNTRQSFLGFITNPILSSEGGKDLEGVLHKTRQISDVLQRTDIFKSVDAYIERSRDPLATENDLQVIFKAREKGRVFLNSSTQFGNNEANGVSRIT